MLVGRLLWIENLTNRAYRIDEGENCWAIESKSRIKGESFWASDLISCV